MFHTPTVKTRNEHSTTVMTVGGELHSSHLLLRTTSHPFPVFRTGKPVDLPLLSGSIAKLGLVSLNMVPLLSS